MVDSVSGAAISSLLRAQSVGVANLKSNQQATQAIINQLQKPAVAVRVSAVTQGSKSAGPSSNLPRGSLVDRLV